MKAGIFNSLLSLKSIFDFCSLHSSDRRQGKINLKVFFRNNRICCFFTICKSRSGCGRIFCTVSYSKYFRRGTLFVQKKVGSALTETENWDLLVDCTSRDGRQMLDAGDFLEIIESVVFSPFVKAEADVVEYFVLCLKRYVRLSDK
jgi:hypothetical protein